MRLPSRLAWLDSRHPALLFGLFLLFFLMHMPMNGIPSSREESFYTQALRLHAPERFQPGTSTHPPARETRLAYDLFGPLAASLDTPTLATVGRALCAVVNALAMTALALALELTALDLLLTMPFFIISLQSLIGDEWLFVHVERKVLAYPLVFLAMARLLRGRATQAGLCLAGAWMLHRNIGLHWTALLALFAWMEARRESVSQAWRPAVRLLLPCCLALVPWLVWLWLEPAYPLAEGVKILERTPEGRSVAWIFGNVLESIHVHPFKNFGELSRWDEGVASTAAICLIAAAILWRPRRKEEEAFVSLGTLCTPARLSLATLRLALLTFLATAWQLVALGLEALDRKSLYLAPWELFRPSSIGFLAFCFLAARFLEDWLGDKGKELKLAGALLALFPFLPHIGQDVLEPVMHQRTQDRLQAATRAHLASLPANATLLVDPSQDYNLNPALPRLQVA